MAASRPGSFELVALELARALSPLAERLHDPHHALTLLAELGLKLPLVSVTPALTAAIATGHTAAHELPELAEQLVAAIDNGAVGPILAKGVAVAQQVVALIGAFDTLASEINGLGGVPLVSPADLAAFVAALPKRLFETVVIEYLDGAWQLPLTLFEFVGVVAKTRQNIGSTDPGRPEFVKKEFHFNRLGQLLTAPDQLLSSLYGWGGPDFDGALLLERISKLLRALKIPVTFWQLDGAPPRPVLEVCILTLTPTAGLSPPGLEANLTRSIGDGISIDVPVAEGWVAHLAVEGALAASVGLRVQPPANVTVIPPSGTVQGKLTAGLARVPVLPETNFVILGAAGGTGLTAERFGINATGAFRWDAGANQARGDFGFSGEIRGGKLRIGMDGADGFLGQILGGVAIAADFNLGFGWSAGQGVYFTGSSALEVQLPVHITLGPVELNALTLRVGIDGNRFPIGLTTDLKANLGPLVAVVEQIGAAIEFSFPAGGRGDIGPLDLDFKFQPPRGAGLSLDVGVVKGGGYLFFDPDHGEYAGALELDIAGLVTCKAIGLITTRMPDGSDGFSLLIIITAEFGTGIQLGFGFTLLAVGGLVGLNRTMRLEPLAEAVRTGAINSVLFPRDVIANAPRIISDLRAFFPPQDGQFLIGPMLKLGWGTPTLVSLSLGVIIEIPGNIAILGVLRLALPADEFAVIVLQVNFIGAIEFDKQRVWFFASLFDSRILFITLSGELGVLAAFGDDANLVVSVGGFHPRYSPPPLPFPVPRRLAISLIDESFARIRVEGYFAVTTNSLQFGALAEASFGFDDFGVEGHLGFDALIIFSPFHFTISASASFSLKLFGVGCYSIGVSFALEGPTPWRVQGTGSFSILFFSIDVDFDFTWGETVDTALPPIAVLPILAEAFGQAQNWRAELPGNARLSVTLRPMGPEESAQVLHPVGTLTARQKAVPLDLTISKVGNQKASDVRRIAVRPAVGAPFQKLADVSDQFAPAQYEELDDAARLSRPSYEPEHSGLQLSASGVLYDTPALAKRSMRYELIRIDTAFRRHQLGLFQLSAMLFGHWLGGNSAAVSDFSRAKRKQVVPFDDAITTGSEQYAVSFVRDNAPVPQGASFRSEGQARDFLRGYLKQNPGQAGQVQIIPAFEVPQ